jgi:hypothetical protein
VRRNDEKIVGKRGKDGCTMERMDEKMVFIDERRRAVHKTKWRAVVLGGDKRTVRR